MASNTWLTRIAVRCRPIFARRSCTEAWKVQVKALHAPWARAGAAIGTNDEIIVTVTAGGHYEDYERDSSHNRKLHWKHSSLK